MCVWQGESADDKHCYGYSSEDCPAEARAGASRAKVAKASLAPREVFFCGLCLPLGLNIEKKLASSEM